MKKSREEVGKRSRASHTRVLRSTQWIQRDSVTEQSDHGAGKYVIGRSGCGVSRTRKGEEHKNNTRDQQADHRDATNGSRRKHFR